MENLIEKKEKLIKQISEKKEKLNFYKEVLQKIPIIIFTTSVKTKLLTYINEGLFSYFDFTEDKSGFLKKIIIPEDYEKAIEQFSNTSCHNNKKKCNIVFHVKYPDNRIEKFLGVTTKFSQEENITIAFHFGGIMLRTEQLLQLRRDLDKEINQLKLAKLSKTELKIAGLIGEELSLKEIATKIKRSYHTVEFHKRNIMNKMKLTKMIDIVQFAKETGISNNF